MINVNKMTMTVIGGAAKLAIGYNPLVKKNLAGVLGQYGVSSESAGALADKRKSLSGKLYRETINMELLKFGIGVSNMAKVKAALEEKGVLVDRIVPKIKDKIERISLNLNSPYGLQPLAVGGSNMMAAHEAPANLRLFFEDIDAGSMSDTSYKSLNEFVAGEGCGIVAKMIKDGNKRVGVILQSVDKETVKKVLEKLEKDASALPEGEMEKRPYIQLLNSIIDNEAALANVLSPEVEFKSNALGKLLDVSANESLIKIMTVAVSGKAPGSLARLLSLVGKIEAGKRKRREGVN